MKKLVRDGRVAVVHTTNYGSGWSTWSDERYGEIMAMDKDIALAVEEGNVEKIKEITEKKCKIEDAYLYIGSNINHLGIKWVPEGSLFEIEEYDGVETVHVIGDRNYFKA